MRKKYFFLVFLLICYFQQIAAIHSNSQVVHDDQIIPIVLEEPNHRNIQYFYLIFKKKCHKIIKKENFIKCGNVIEYPLFWPNDGTDNTHELTYNRKGGKFFWITGETHDALARISLKGKVDFFAMPPGSSPHGVVFDRKGHLWVTFEGAGAVVRVNKEGKIVELVDVHFKLPNGEIINPGPHGLCLSADGKSLWFTGKAGNTVGKILLKDRSVEQFLLPTANSLPIYIAPGQKNSIWCTELTGNNIARITQDGQIIEFPIPTPNSRPIGIVLSTEDNKMWFSEENGHNVASITFDGKITEFPVPKTQENVLLASLTFDSFGNLWTESYVSQANPFPQGADNIVKIDRKIQEVYLEENLEVPLTYYEVPSRNTVFHRIIQGPDGNIWFTELAVDHVGKILINSCKCNK